MEFEEIQTIVIKNKYTKLAIKSGNYFFIFTILLAGASHFNIFDLSHIPIPNFDLLLWGYIILSSLIATPFIYLERKTRVSVDKTCNLCGSSLEIVPRYKCPECGYIIEKK